jgi:hypothetical protein
VVGGRGEKPAQRCHLCAGVDCRGWYLTHGYPCGRAGAVTARVLAPALAPESRTQALAVPHRIRPQPWSRGVERWWSVVRSPRPRDLGIELLVAVRTGNVVPHRGADEPTIRVPPLRKALPYGRVHGVIQGTRQTDGQADVVLTHSFTHGTPLPRSSNCLTM